MWWFYALTNALAGSFSNVFTKLAGGKINPILAALIAQITAVCSIFLFFLIIDRNFQSTKQGVIFAVLMGLMSAIGYTAWFKLFSTGAPLVTAGTLAITGVIVFTAIWGVVFLGEKLTPTALLGFVLALVSVFLLAR